MMIDAITMCGIIGTIEETVNVIEVIKPVFNFKAADGDLPWKKK